MAGRDLPAAMTRDQQFMAAIVDGLDEVAGLLRDRLPEPEQKVEVRVGTVKVSEPDTPAEPDAVEQPVRPAAKKTAPRTRRKPSST